MCPLPPDNCPPDGDVVVGFRPGALALSDTKGADDLAVTVITVESLGEEKNTAMWTARVDPRERVSPGDQITLRFDLDAFIHDGYRVSRTLSAPVSAGREKTS